MSTTHPEKLSCIKEVQVKSNRTPETVFKNWFGRYLIFNFKISPANQKTNNSLTLRATVSDMRTPGFTRRSTID